MSEEIPRTYAAFVEDVKERLLANANRQGTEAFRDACILDCVIGLQNRIPQLQYRSTVELLHTDGVAGAYAQEFNHPTVSDTDDVTIHEVWVRLVDSVCEDCDPDIKLLAERKSWKWEKQLRAGSYGADDRTVSRFGGYFSINPNLSKVLLYPKLADGEVAELVVSGVRHQFNDDTQVRFGSREAHIVATYVMSRFYKDMDGDMEQFVITDSLYNRLRNIRKADLKKRLLGIEVS